MPLSGTIGVTSREGAAGTPAAARGAAATYTPAHSDAAGPRAPTAPIPGAGGPSAPVRAPIPGVQAAEAEPEQAEGTEQAAEEQPEAWRLAAVARKDRMARERLDEAKKAEAEVKALRQAIEEERKAFENERKELEARRSEWRKNPRALLQDNGYNPEAALQFMLNNDQLTPEQKLAASLDERLAEADRRQQEALANLKADQEKREQARLEESKKAEQARREQEAEAAIQEFKAEIAEEVGALGEQTPILAKMGSRGVDAVFEHIDQEFAKTGKRLNVKAAALAVEAQALEDAKEWLPVLAPRLGLSPAGPAPVRRQQTLTNRPAAPAVEQPNRPETAAEQRERVRRIVEERLRQGRIR